MGWLITLVVLTLIAMIPLGVNASYRDSDFLVRLILGPARITLYPRKKKLDEPTKKVRKKSVKEEKKPEEEKNGGSISDFFPLIRTALDFLGEFRRKLRVDNLLFKIYMAADDPCDLAIQYGKTWAAVGNLMPHLESLFKIRKRDVEVLCDFQSSKTTVVFSADLTVTFGRLLCLLIWYGIKALKQYLSIMKLRKGGADL